MSKIIKKQDVTVLIESIMKQVGVKTKKTIIESKKSKEMSVETLSDLIKKLKDLMAKGETEIPSNLDQMLKDSAKQVIKKHTGKDVDIDNKLKDVKESKKDLDTLIETTISKVGLLKEYDPVIGKTINTLRKFNTSGKLAKVLSLIHDLVNLDFDAAKQSITNKEGFNKISYVLRELGLIGMILDRINNTACKGGSCLRGLDITDLKKPRFNELVEYGFDVDKIIEYLNDEDVLEYLNHDVKLRVRMSELDSIVSFLEELKAQYDGVVTESKSEEKPLINEDIQREMDRFKKLSNYTYKK